MDDQALLDLLETEWGLTTFRLESGLGVDLEWYAGGFNIDGYRPNWSDWSAMEYWTVEEATCLSIGFQPQKMPLEDKEIPVPSEPLNFFWTRMEQVRRADSYDAKNPGVFKPATFVRWALKKGLHVPDDMEAMFEAPSSPAMLEKIDRRQYDSALLVILGLLADEYGYRGGAPGPDVAKDIAIGLKNLDLRIDPKTLGKVLTLAANHLPRFVAKQRERDENRD
jgi:hypothetical protein